ncbi:Heterokaryon incompatibility protein 6 OR allele [Lachnellula suecica]|uniref:Heterokaryon incompatibility protein 6 OR allele n=1 Tax=Lachnellula suecica TaxID=602035 RepID=A0A8T9C9D4_9HELO|nr:Heterokaryon incompatibility protein 6 OR allele [Lachnellula suecica]
MFRRHAETTKLRRSTATILLYSHKLGSRRRAETKPTNNNIVQYLITGHRAMESYPYQPLRGELQEIRLVHLLPGEFKDPIKIRILHSPSPVPPMSPSKEEKIQVDSLRSLVSWPWAIEETEDGEIMMFDVVTGETHPIPTVEPPLEETPEYHPRYEALSYTWGDNDICELAQVQIEGSHTIDETFATLGLRSNLASALRCLRHRNEIRILWIDAICINQEDIEERNEQVKRMTDIYTLARRVIAWLGMESNNSKHAFATLQHVGQQLKATKSGRIIAAPNATEPQLWRNDHIPSFNQPTWQALIDFVEREWFYRIWCWQEVKLGGQNVLLQCGSSTISWNSFWMAVLCLHNKDSSPSMWFRERCRHIVFLKHDAASHSLSNILDISRSKGCVNPRDKIYGLLGITPAYFSSNIIVDYLRPVEDVYKEAFLTHLNTTKRLELLKHCDLASRNIGGPSWVPDWSKTEFAAPILSEQLSAGISRAWFTYMEPEILEVIGKQYTTIKSVSGVASKVEEETLLAVGDWFHHLPDESTYATGESMEEAFALTLCMNRTRERHPYTHFLNVSEWAEMLRKILRLTAASKDDPIYAERETANTIQKIRGRRFFTTDDGHIGTAPAGAQVADAICLLLGTYAPMVLRQTASGSFQVVGECYVHGLADLTGFLGPLPNHWETIIKGDALGRPTQRFIDTGSGEETLEDPRLEPLPWNWERATYGRRAEDPAIFERFRNLETDEVVNYDPRLSPTALEARGVKLQSFRLI